MAKIVKFDKVFCLSLIIMFQEKVSSADEATKFLQNGCAVKQAIGVFEVSSKTELPKTMEKKFNRR